MKRSSLLLAVLILCAGVSQAETEQDVGKSVLFDGVAAYVNDETISIAEIMSEVRRASMNWSGVSEAERDSRLRELYQATLNAMVDRKLILASARESKIQLQPWAVQGRIRDIIDQHFDGDKAKLAKALAEQQRTYEEWAKSISDDLTLSMMRYSQVDQKVNLSPGQIRAYYEAHKKKFASQGGIRVSMILLQDDREKTAAEQAEEVMAALTKGDSFAVLAKRFSKDSKSADGGSWGVVNPEDEFSKPIIDALAALKVREFSEPITLGANIYIVRKDAEVPSKTLSMEDAWKYAEAELRLIEQEKAYHAWTSRLRARAYIKMMELPPSD